VAKHHGPNHPAMPAYAAFLRNWSHLAFAGYLGKRYDPFIANTAVRLPVYDLVGRDTGQLSTPQLFRLPGGLTFERIGDRRPPLPRSDGLRGRVDAGPAEALDRFGQQAVELLTGRRMQEALDLSREPQRVRDRYGSHLWCQQALLARRMIEAGGAFVTIDPTYPTPPGAGGTHRDNNPPPRGIRPRAGWAPPPFAHLLHPPVR